jgi:hypothetical protein
MQTIRDNLLYREFATKYAYRERGVCGLTCVPSRRIEEIEAAVERKRRDAGNVPGLLQAEAEHTRLSAVLLSLQQSVRHPYPVVLSGWVSVLNVRCCSRLSPLSHISSQASELQGKMRVHADTVTEIEYHLAHSRDLENIDTVVRDKRIQVAVRCRPVSLCISLCVCLCVSVGACVVLK